MAEALSIDALLDQVAERAARRVLAEFERLKAPDQRPPLVIPAAAKQMGVSVRTLRSAISNGRVKVVQPGGKGTRVKVPAAEVDRFNAGKVRS
jgi:excisionase family DNA binding protein